MNELVLIMNLYKWPILAGLSAAVALALFGCVLAARERAVQTLVLSQSASFGALLGMAISLTYFPGKGLGLLPFVIAFLTAAVGYFQSEKVIAQHYASKASFFIFIYLAFVSFSHLLAAIIPALESHMSRIIFGDLATLTNSEAWITIVMSLLVFGYLITQNKIIIRLAFSEMVLSHQSFVPNDKKQEHFFKFVFLIYISFVTQALGLLFTMSLLFIPTILALLSQKAHLRRHQIIAVGLGFTGTLIGVFTSLLFTQLPTVSTIVIVTLILGVFISWL